MHKWFLYLGCGLPLPALAQTKPALTGTAPAAAPPAVAAPAAVVPADTGQFPLRYCTVLPRPDFVHWDADYTRYARLATPEIRRTQVGLRLVSGGVHYWHLEPAATAPAQLDTLTRVADPTRLQGRWYSVSSRTILYCDSAVLGEKRIYRSVRQLPRPPERDQLTLADGRLTLQAAHGSEAPLQKLGRKKYEVINGRYLLLYGLSKAGGAVSQIGLDAQGRLVLHSYAVTERKIPGQYQTYVTVLNQVIFEHSSD